ncbi:hypothetical protein HALLA_11930 [Halostagnicola larsenii XH-48]|uniref:Uncharacterized protein n=2 Tax=Halostagnicola larsenii TaxID=353800 RepID=W0JUL9_9EURY|nr:hypothetical protein HALLA_11930 [Halostagnicola larsenii XH-48]
MERENLPPQCQLCQLLDYRGDFINEPEGMVEVARDDGGSKIVHCCERCAEELFDDPEFTAYECCEVCAEPLEGETTMVPTGEAHVECAEADPMSGAWFR